MLKSFEAVAENGVIRLPADVPSAARCVVTILDGAPATLRGQANCVLPEATQQRMSELLVKNREGQLTLEESQELDLLAEEFDTATLTNGRALATLALLNGDSKRVVAALSEVIKKDAIGPWLNQPNDAFEGLKPIEVIERGEVDRIWQMVYFLRSGVAS